jgi:hypothetical protein
MTKRLELLGLLVLCTLVLVFPVHINNLYDTILGRLVLIVVLIFLTLNNTTFGLLFALCIIISLSLYFREGMENNDKTGITIGEENVENNDINKIKVLTSLQEDEEEKEGVDRQTIEESVRPVSSKELNNQKQNNNEEVMPNDESVEKFSCMGSIYM